MYKRLKIKLFKIRSNSPNVQIRMVVVGFNNKVDGSYVERLGVFYREHEVNIILLDMKRLTYWLSKDVKMKSRVSWAIGLLGEMERNIKQDVK